MTDDRAKDTRPRVKCRVWWLGVLVGVVLIVLLDAFTAAHAAGGIEEVKSFATKLTNYVTAVAASVAVLFMAISGVRWTMSSGDRPN